MSGVGEASLVLGLVSSCIAIFEAAHEIYEAASDASGLPKRLRFAAEQIPLVYHALGLAQQNINAKNTTGDTLKAVKPVLEQCEKSASAVKDIFEKTIPAKDASKTERRKKAVGVMLKSSKVKEHMEEVFKGLELLAQNQVLQDAETLEDIKTAVEDLANIPDKEEQSQFIHSGTGSLNANTGGGSQENYSNSGAGTQYNAQNQYFGGDQDDKIPPLVYELPSFLLSPYFTGRSDELDRINGAFSISSGDLPQLCIIHGMPGLGKTQLALKFATLACQNAQHPYIFWISAASVDKLSQDVSKMVDLLHLPRRHTQNSVSRVTAARAWLEDSTAAKSWLVVLDNVGEETAVATLHEFLPRRNCEGRILMTTRFASIVERYTAMEGSSIVALEAPEVGDAVAILLAGGRLRQSDQTETNRADLERLVRSVGNLPLAIDQAASYMRESQSSAQEIFDTYKGGEVLEILEWTNNLSQHEERSVLAIYTTALNRMRQTAPDAAVLLKVLCFCDPEGIPISILQQGCAALQAKRDRSSQARALRKVEASGGSRRSLKGAFSALHIKSRQTPIKPPNDEKLEAVRGLIQSPIRLSKAIHEIQRLSFATEANEGTDRIIRIHDLVHVFLQSKLMSDTERVQWLKVVINVVCKAFEGSGDSREPKTWGRYSQFVSHIEFLERLAEKYGIENSEILDASTWAASYLQKVGLYEKAGTWLERIVNQEKRILGERHLSTMQSVSVLAVVFGRQGKYKESEMLNREILEFRTSVLGTKNPDTLSSMNNLAASLSNQGKYQEAERMNRRILDLRVSVLGEKHPDTLRVMSNLAVTLQDQGNYQEAERINRQSLDLRVSVLGEKHPDTLASMNNLAVTLKNRGKYQEAEKMNRQTLDLYISVLGKDHPDTLMGMNNLALVLMDQGKNQEAERMSRRVLDLKLSVLDKEHPGTLRSMNVLALALTRQGKYQEAERMIRRTLDVRTSVLGMLGKEHPDVLQSKIDLATCFWYQDRIEEAEELQVQTLEMAKRVLGAKHPDTLNVMHDLARSWKSQNRNEEAIALMEECCELRIQVLGLEHPHTQGSLAALGLWENEGHKTEDSG